MSQRSAPFRTFAGSKCREPACPKVAVVVLNWNAAELTLQCLNSVRASDYGRIEAVVVDNGSTDGSPDAIASRHPGAILIRNASNAGFAQGSNQGIRRAMQDGADYILLLNNDTAIGEGMISRLVETAVNHENRAAVSPKMYDGRDPRRLWFVYGKTSLWTGIFSNPAYNVPASTAFNPVVAMQYASGCCVLIPRGIIASVGELDPDFFAYCEDVEWSLRARRAGYELLCDTRAKLWHYVGSTGGKNPARMRYLMTRNHVWTLRKHAGTWQFLVFALVFYPPRCIFRLMKAVRNRSWACVAAEFRGARDGFFGRTSRSKRSSRSRYLKETS